MESEHEGREDGDGLSGDDLNKRYTSRVKIQHHYVHVASDNIPAAVAGATGEMGGTMRETREGQTEDRVSGEGAGAPASTPDMLFFHFHLTAMVVKMHVARENEMDADPGNEDTRTMYCRALALGIPLHEWPSWIRAQFCRNFVGALFEDVDDADVCGEGAGMDSDGVFDDDELDNDELNSNTDDVGSDVGTGAGTGSGTGTGGTLADCRADVGVHMAMHVRTPIISVGPGNKGNHSTKNCTPGCGEVQVEHKNMASPNALGLERAKKEGAEKKRKEDEDDCGGGGGGDYGGLQRPESCPSVPSEDQVFRVINHDPIVPRPASAASGIGGTRGRGASFSTSPSSPVNPFNPSPRKTFIVGDDGILREEVEDDDAVGRNERDDTAGGSGRWEKWQGRQNSSGITFVTPRRGWQGWGDMGEEGRGGGGGVTESEDEEEMEV